MIRSQTMIMSLLLFSAPALADVATGFATDCENIVWPYVANDFGDVPLPVDGAIPVLLMSECGGSGDVDVTLHRVVDDQLAEATVTVSTNVNSNEWRVVTLEAEAPLLEETDYAIMASERVFHFTTGVDSAQGMDNQAPSLEFGEIVYYDMGADSYDLSADLSITPAPDVDGLSIIELVNSTAPDTPIMAYLPGQWDEINTHIVERTDSVDETCFFVVQTDGLGNVSAPSVESCQTPENADGSGGWWCSSSGSLPTLWTSLLALGAAVFRRQRK